jgi:uncharacterized protein (TIGR02646 family)
MIRIGRNNERPDLRCYQPRQQSGLKRFDYRYEGETISDAEYEAKVARDHYENDAHYEVKDGRRQLTKRGKDFEFWVYAKDEVRTALTEEFRGKCAYCEYEIGIRTDFDIEHFRPKKAVNVTGQEELREPGYYWLAASWSNLMPSCQFCNQIRKHEIAGEVGSVAIGKKNQFPLRDESKRITSPDADLADEEDYRLLINPSTDRPEEHMIFVTEVTREDEEELGMVKAVKNGAKADEMGESSILVYALNTRLLVDRRHEHMSDVIRVLTSLKDAAKGYHAAETGGLGEISQMFFNLLQNATEQLRDKLKPNAVFLGLARQLVREFDQDDQFEIAKRCGVDPMEMVAMSVEATERVEPCKVEAPGQRVPLPPGYHR